MLGQWAFILTLAISLLGASPAWAAKPACGQALLTVEEAHNLSLKKQYLETNEFHYDHTIDSFRKATQYYSDLILKSKNPDYAIRFLNDSPYTYTVFERYKILIDRKITPEARFKLNENRNQAQENLQKLGPFLSKNKDLNERQKQLLQALEPAVDGLNVKTKKEARHWKDATEYLIGLIRGKIPLDRQELTSLALILQGNDPKHPAAMAEFLGPTDINYMLLPSKTKPGKLILDPKYSFIPGSVKSDAISDFFIWLNKMDKKMDPIELAAEARVRIVSIHAFPDNNGRLARLVANSILMKHGYPPASIPRGKKGSSSVVIFPLLDFHQQIAPERSYELMLEGVLRSQEFLLRQ